MRLIYLSTSRIPGEKANTYQVLQMCDAFSQIKLEIILLHPKRINIPPLSQVRNIRKFYNLKNDFTIIELPALDLFPVSNKLFSNFPKLLNIFNRISFRLLLLTYCVSLLFYLKDHHAKFYYCRDLTIIQWIGKIYPKLRSKMIYEAHVFPDQSYRGKTHTNLHNYIGGLITTNTYISDFFLKKGINSEKILIAPNGVDLDRFIQINKDKNEIRALLSLPSDIIIVGFVGQLEALEKERGIAQIIEAISILKKKYPNMKVSLCCVGGTEDICLKYQLIANNFELNETEAIFIRQVPPQVIPQYLCAFDICVLPFPRTRYYTYEVSPLKLFEYMASKQVILSSKLPSIQEILKHKYNAYLVESK